jgi:hypothetical protein
VNGNGYNILTRDTLYCFICKKCKYVHRISKYYLEYKIKPKLEESAKQELALQTEEIVKYNHLKLIFKCTHKRFIDTVFTGLEAHKLIEVYRKKGINLTQIN